MIGHSDIFDHPSYRNFCMKDGKKELFCPAIQCKKCKYIKNNK